MLYLADLLFMNAPRDELTHIKDHMTLERVHRASEVIVGDGILHQFHGGFGPKPRGSKYPIFEASGSKNHNLNGFGDQRT